MYINYDPGLTLTYFMERLNLAPKALEWKEVEKDNLFGFCCHGAVPYRILVVQNRILFIISGHYLCKSLYIGRVSILKISIIKTVVLLLQSVSPRNIRDPCLRANAQYKLEKNPPLLCKACRSRSYICVYLTASKFSLQVFECSETHVL